MALGAVRYHVHIKRPAGDVWKLAGDPTRLHEWFPGITDCRVDGSTRVIVTGSGMPMPEEILVNDPILRHFQYRVVAPIFRHHRGTIDVLDMGDGSCVAVYSTEADPRAMALTIGGATAGALDELKRQMEARTDEPDSTPGAN
jgi:hypothetical protein